MAGNEEKKESKKIAIVTPYAVPEKGACSLRISSFKNFLEEEGFLVRIFAPERKPGQEMPGFTRYKGFGNLIRSISKEKPDLAIGTSPPMTHSFVALLFCKLSGIPFILDLRDPWTHAYGNMGVYKKSSPKLFVYRLIEKLSYLLADRIFVVTKNTGEIAEKSWANPSKTRLVENGTDVSLFSYNSKERLSIRKKLGLGEKDALGIYAGSFALRGVENVLEALAPLLREGKLKLLLVVPKESDSNGGFSQLSGIVKKEHIEENVFFVDSSEKGIGFEELYKYFSAADFGIDVLPLNLGYCIPVKTYDYLACGLPVIAYGPKEGALKDLFGEFNIGFYSSSLEGFKENIARAISDADSLRERKPFLADLAKKRFDRKFANRKALDEIMGLIK